MAYTDHIKADRTEVRAGALHQDFGTVDKKGRAVGAAVYLATVTWTKSDAPDDGRSFYSREPAEFGTFFTYTPSATRAGVHYGASQGQVEFRTFEEREAAIAKYFKAAKRRALKAFPQGGAL